MDYSILDYAILAILSLSVVIGLWRGLLKEVLSLATWLLALFVSMRFSPDIMGYLAGAIPDERVQYVVALIVLFVLSALVGVIVTQVISKSAKVVGLGFFDRLLGAVFGVLRGAVVVVILLLLIKASPFADKDWSNNAVLPQYFSPAVQYFEGMAPVKLLAIKQWIMNVTRV